MSYFDPEDFDGEKTYRSRGSSPQVGLDVERPVPKNYGNTSNIDLDKALADQYAEAESFRDHMLNNSDSVKPTDVTSAVGSVNRILQQIINMRETVQNIARMQLFEAAVVKTMKEAPPEIRDKFFADLEKRLKAQ